MLTRMEPRVRIEVVDCPAGSQPVGLWRVSWLVHNDEPGPLELHNAWIPHGRFCGQGRLPLSVRVPAGGSARLHFSVHAAEPPGTVVHNAYLILQVSGNGRAWRIFTRMRVEFDAQAQPRPIVEVITSQSIQ
jgi:hypothetical protein